MSSPLPPCRKRSIPAITARAPRGARSQPGSRTAVFALEPDIAIAIDVTWATEVPGGDAKLHGKIELGSGAAIMRGPVANTHISDLLTEVAEAEGITHCFEIYTGRTMTDADALFVSRGGVPT